MYLVCPRPCRTAVRPVTRWPTAGSADGLRRQRLDRIGLARQYRRQPQLDVGQWLVDIQLVAFQTRLCSFMVSPPRVAHE